MVANQGQLESVRARAAAEWRRSAQAAEKAARHELAAVTAPPSLRQFHRNAVAVLRQLEAYHLVAAGMHSAHLARLRSRAQLDRVGRALAPGSPGGGVVDRPGDGSAPVTRRSLAPDLPTAIRRGELFLEYQPVVALGDGQIIGGEALVRWRHPVLGLLYPDRFIGVAEETGMMLPLTRFVLRQACRDAAGWGKVTPRPPKVSVNVSPSQLAATDLVAEVAGALRETGLPPARLTLEVTEGAIFPPGEQALGTLRRLRDLGVSVAIDDFGTGYSNLSILRKLPAQELKVDRSLVCDLCRSDRKDCDEGRQILAAIGALAHSTGLAVTAEGVETAQQAEFLRAIGYEYAQGWYCGEPAEVQAFESTIAAGAPRMRVVPAGQLTGDRAGDGSPPR